MVEERTCDYTGEPIEPGTGIMYVRADGSVLHFVDSKAEKNYFLGREARDLSWTEAGREAAEARSPDEAETSEASAPESEEDEEREAPEASPESDEPAEEAADAGKTDDGEAETNEAS